MTTATIDQLRDRSLDLKIEKADTMAELAEVNERLARFLQPEELAAARTAKAELAADMAGIDVDLAKTNAAIEKLVHSERRREHHLNNIRLLTAAFIHLDTDLKDAVRFATLVEADIQSLYPEPTIQLPVENEESAA